jgi:hypothetical protein
MGYHLVYIPDDVYDRAQQIAAESAQTVDALLTEQLRMLTAPKPASSSVENAELSAMRCLPDEALRAIVREQTPAEIQKRTQRLMDRNNFGAITHAELDELERYVECGNRLMMRKAEAARLLMDRGHHFLQRDTLPFFHFD